MSRDFIDEDLLKISRGQRAGGDETPSRTQSAISREALAKMTQQKGELNHQVAEAVHEIEELKQRQEALEREKRDLEELARRQDDYTSGKREIIEQLTGSIMLLEKEELQSARLLELLGVIRSKFRDSLAELRSISESDWAEDAYQMELNKAIVIVEDAKSTLKKGIAKMEAAGWNRDRPGPVSSPSQVAAGMQSKSFWYWFKAGLAISIPFIVFAAALFVLWLYFSGMF